MLQGVKALAGGVLRACLYPLFAALLALLAVVVLPAVRLWVSLGRWSSRRQLQHLIALRGAR